MREIKFRGVSVNDGEWYYGDLVQCNNKNYIYYCSKKPNYDYRDTGHLMEEVITETVGQFSGLKDVNGTEIYEGDILQDKYKDEHYLVKYKDGGFSVLLNFDTEGRVFDIDLFEVCGKYTDVEVISNIYEESIKEKENE